MTRRFFQYDHNPDDPKIYQIARLTILQHRSWRAKIMNLINFSSQNEAEILYIMAV